MFPAYESFPKEPASSQTLSLSPPFLARVLPSFPILPKHSRCRAPRLARGLSRLAVLMPGPGWVRVVVRWVRVSDRPQTRMNAGRVRVVRVGPGLSLTLPYTPYMHAYYVCVTNTISGSYGKERNIPGPTRTTRTQARIYWLSSRWPYPDPTRTHRRHTRTHSSDGLPIEAVPPIAAFAHRAAAVAANPRPVLPEAHADQTMHDPVLIALGPATLFNAESLFHDLGH